jgi:hypothetical protein
MKEKRGRRAETIEKQPVNFWKCSYVDIWSFSV